MEPFLSQINMFGFNFAPKGWALCDGQLMTANQNQALFALLGDTFGGDARTNFALPEMRGRTPVHYGQSVPYMGISSGDEQVTLTTATMPHHTHTISANTVEATTNDPSDQVLTQSQSGKPFYNTDNLVPMSTAAISNTGSGQAHQNMQPSLVVSFCIAITGQFPSRN